MTNIWLIGASEGIGRDLALELAKESHFLILSGRSKNRLESLQKEIGKQARVEVLDVTDLGKVAKAFSKITKSYKIDKIIYLAGYYKPMSADNFNIGDVEKIIDINLIGAYRICDKILPYFIEQNAGHIILVGSIAGYRGLPNSIGYGSSKAGLIHLAENLKCDLKKYNIKVQVINPGFVKTRLTDMNKFYMPSIISTEMAAKYIVKIIKKNVFESTFPSLFTYFIKFLSILPYALYFKIASILKPKNNS